MTYDATLTALVANYRRDPHRQAEVEKKYRISDTSLEFTNAEFQNVAKMGQNVEVNNEPFVKVTDYDGYAKSTPQNIKDSKQAFVIDKAAKFDVRVFDIDDVQTEDDLNGLILNSANYQQSRFMTRARFQAIKDATTIQLSEIDVSSGGAPSWQNSTAGNAVFNALSAAKLSLSVQGMRPNDLKAALPAYACGALQYSGYLQNSTEGQNEMNEKGAVGKLVNTNLFESVDTPKTEVDYVATTAAAIAVGDDTVLVDTVLDGAGTPLAVEPLPSDYFVSDSETYTILAVSATDTADTYRLTLDRPVETAVTDNTVLTVTGYTHENIIYASGKPLSGVVQQNFGLKASEEDDYFAARLKGMTLFGNFMTTEQGRRCVIVPLKVRTYVAVT